MVPRSRYPISVNEIGQNGPLSSLFEVNGGAYYFPGDLDVIDHWAAFRIAKRTRPWRDEIDRLSEICTIFLPLPAQLSTGYRADYSSEDLGMIGAAGAIMGAGASKMLEALKGMGVDSLVAAGGMDMGQLSKVMGDAGSQTSGSIKDVIESVAGGELNSGSIKNLLGAFAVQQLMGLTGDLGAGVGFGAGIARNPHKALLFTGVGFRHHTFAYRFSPRDAAESNTLTQIIKRFKYHMAPELTANRQFFEYPDEVDIDFHHAQHLFNIGASVLTDFRVEYHPQNTPVYFRETQAPAEVSIAMDFTEVTITTKAEVKNQNR